MNMTISQCVAMIRHSLGSAALPPVTSQAVLAFEQMHQLALPPEVATLLDGFNGSTEPIPNSLVSFIPLEEWASPAKVIGTRYEHLTTLFILADYCHESWWYAVELNGEQSTPVYLINGVQPEEKITSTLAEFLLAAAHDGPSLYGRANPSDAGAGCSAK